MVREGLGLNHPELVKLMADASVATVQWTISELGTKYTDNLVQEGGHAVPRSYQTYNNSGSAIVQPQLAKLKALGVEPRFQVYLQKVLRDKDGRVKGVEIRRATSSLKQAAARSRPSGRKAVVLAYGGSLRTWPSARFRTLSSPPCSTAPTSRRYGRRHQGGPQNRLHTRSTVLDTGRPMGEPRREGFRLGSPFCSGGRGHVRSVGRHQDGQAVHQRAGQCKLRADKIMELGNKGEKCIAVTDATGASWVKDLLPNFWRAAWSGSSLPLRTGSGLQCPPCGPQRDHR